MKFSLSIFFLFSFTIQFTAAQGSGPGINLTDIKKYKSIKPDTAFYMAKSMYMNAQKEGNRQLEAECALELGGILYFLGDFENANQYLIKATDYFEKSIDNYKLAEGLTWQGIVAQYSRQYDMTLPLYLKALDIYIELGDSAKAAEVYGWIGHYHEKTGNPETALHYQYKAMRSLAQKDNTTHALAHIYDNLGSLYEDLGNFDLAFYYFSKALEISRSIKEINSLIVNLNNIGDIFRKRGLFEEALFYTDSALIYAEKNKLNYQVRSAHRDFAKLYSQMRNYEKAYEHLDIAYDLYSTLLNDDNLRRMVMLRAMYETERKENLIALLEKDSRFNRLLRIGMLAVFAILFLLALIIIRTQRLKMKQNKKILEQKTQLFSNQEELNKLELKNVLLKEEKLKTELENQKLRENELQQSIVLKSQLITSHTLQVIRKNNFLETLKHDLQKIRKSEKKDRNVLIGGMIKSINRDINNDENWDDFRIIFGHVHKDFFAKLKYSFPELSPTEMRLCALLKLNLHSQEIATIMGVSFDSLRIARYRLRKKLRMDKSENLIAFLMDI